MVFRDLTNLTIADVFGVFTGFWLVRLPSWFLTAT
jgi:hypothetical protein